jgi:hypothetical protein
VTDILESLGRVLATNVEEDFLTTAVRQLALYTREVSFAPRNTGFGGKKVVC